MVSVLNKTWCIEHFRCTGCDAPLASSRSDSRIDLQNRYNYRLTVHFRIIDITLAIASSISLSLSMLEIVMCGLQNNYRCPNLIACISNTSCAKDTVTMLWLLFLLVPETWEFLVYSWSNILPPSQGRGTLHWHGWAALLQEVLWEGAHWVAQTSEETSRLSQQRITCLVFFQKWNNLLNTHDVVYMKRIVNFYCRISMDDFHKLLYIGACNFTQ